MELGLTRFNPFRKHQHAGPLHRFGDYMHALRLKRLLRHYEAEPRIRVDVSETAQAYTIRAEIPGVAKGDIEVEIDGNTVSLLARTRRESDAGAEDSFVCAERYVGQQYRSFTLDHDIDEALASASYNDGVLELLLPKKAASATLIEVQ
jgi:HSP20 family protein